MARSSSRSLASKAGSAARKVVSRGRKAADAAAEATTTTSATAGAAKKSAAKKAPAKRAPAKKAPAATKAAAKKATAATKARAEKASAKKTPAKKAPAKKATAATKAPAKKASAKKAPAKKAPAATKTVAKKAPAAKAARRADPRSLVVAAHEKPWTAAEIAEVRGQLEADVTRLNAELAVTDGELQDLMRDSGDGAGNDQADVGSSTFERDQEISLANNFREMLTQSEHALERIADGTYGRCENCGEPIGKMRLMAFPRATLCMSCKQREERR